MNKRTIVIAVVGMMLLGMAGGVQVSQAIPLEWNLVDARFEDGTYAVGSFIFDAQYSVISNFRIETFVGRYLDGFTYTPANSVAIFNPSAGFHYITIRKRPGDREFRIELDGPMTEGGGTIWIHQSSAGETGPAVRHRGSPTRTRYFEDFYIDGVRRRPAVSTTPRPPIRVPTCFISSLAW